MSGQLSAAIDRSSEFYQLRPRHIKKVNIIWPTALVQIGPCSQLNYVSDKFDETLREYFHKFEKLPMIFASAVKQPDGSEILIIKGRFEIKPEGITG